MCSGSLWIGLNARWSGTPAQKVKVKITRHAYLQATRLLLGHQSVPYIPLCEYRDEAKVTDRW